ncbi:uncharacterized protein LOC126901965 isoform X2 [Daktulosphaira vitifoliae]|nr:uncharacterized protein LOC126901965 isoform X2 [Daktulosphaira vitifoliae]XP_050534928.1 uncharacterized protein LOC126901965 isoform X2 [Daktulosphaira vitifoliae]XP_050534935.1 uncharacterized protein LOC126901965 isoform X2 [Daktulosphaira vitifoliae]XP_050534945.1 uncharacterized protein LOC126901965 isoform X2 [Daktulosphaira vitifoliae]XP_050534951.1 uncharacterized protein LOC126901965 isoform X2 [Daktulosphaira vitifoliae]
MTAKPPISNTSTPPPPPAPSIPPPPPCAPAGPPPPPPPMANINGPPIVRKPPTPEKMKKIDALRSRPKKRPDWSDMMKEVESGRKLKHVECNDRSAPIIPSNKSKDKFMYESEAKAESTDHHQLLKDIQHGIKLRKVTTNDKSKPYIEGLRKFRKQATIEEKIQKSVSMADVVAAAAEPDELDDIDKVRDDLQSAKQMLALELRSKEALERENKRLLARVANLQEELQDKPSGHETTRSDKDQQLINKLKEEASEADRIVKDMEQKYHITAEELDSTRRKLESAWLRNQQLEMELKAALAGRVISAQPVPRQMSMKKLSVAPSVDHLSEEEEEEDEDDDDSSEDDSSGSQEMDDARRTARELKLLQVKVKSLRDKQVSAVKERKMLKQELTKKQKELKAEKKKYKVLQKEVDKMAKLMRETGEEDEDEEEEETEEQEEEESEEETETESDDSDDDTQSEGEAPESASPEEKKDNLNRRSKYYEGRLASLKKGNYLLKANVERLQDDVNKQKEMSLVLQEDLNSVLTELG